MHKSLNIPGFFALILIALTFFVAVFVYYLAPDSSPYANEMHLELSLLEPHTEVSFIKLRNQNKIDVSFLDKEEVTRKICAIFHEKNIPDNNTPTRTPTARL